MNWWQTLGVILSGGGVAGFLGSLVNGLLNRPKSKAEAVVALTDAAVKQVNELQEQVTEARAEAVAARRETAAGRAENAAARAETEEARRHVRLLTAEVDACTRTMRAWRAAILSPAATVDGLRAMVGTESGSNGTST